MNTLSYFEVRAQSAAREEATLVRAFDAEDAAEQWAVANRSPAPREEQIVIVGDEDGGETRWRVTARVKTVYSAWREDE